ncbi:hypothetical protein BaRGS_00033619 [Batillaria attramentaria]|uniref:Bcl-2 Bcl-2 homology region 1-3 domain-containing protein n=1 Tax=Batillaria attramentaria TaxID=370345 RepID=A0ABD0JL03_9CAEN
MTAQGGATLVARRPSSQGLPRLRIARGRSNDDFEFQGDAFGDENVEETWETEEDVVEEGKQLFQNFVFERVRTETPDAVQDIQILTPAGYANPVWAKTGRELRHMADVFAQTAERKRVKQKASEKYMFFSRNGMQPAGKGFTPVTQASGISLRSCSRTCMSRAPKQTRAVIALPCHVASENSLANDSELFISITSCRAITGSQLIDIQTKCFSPGICPLNLTRNVSGIGVSTNITYEEFKDLLTELFAAGGITKERIVVLFFFCSDVAIRCLKRGAELCSQFITWSMSFITEKVCSWVRSHGGWGAVMGSSFNSLPRVLLLATAIFIGFGVIRYISRQ